MGFVSKWPVLHRHQVTAANTRAGGVLRDDVLRRWVEEACDAYLAECRAVAASGLAVRRRAGHDLRAERLWHPGLVLVSARATELRTSSFTIAIRVRGVGEGAREGSLDTAREIVLADPATGEARDVDDAIRDELIAIEQAARFVN
jgi:acyl-CoA thioesterase FadM